MAAFGQCSLQYPLSSPPRLLSSISAAPRTRTGTTVAIAIKKDLIKGKRTVKTLNKVSSQNQTPIAADEAKDLILVESASGVVKRFYRGINGRDLSSVEELIADDCVYEDLIFPRPFVGRKDILNFFRKFINSISGDLQFIIDDIAEDFLAVGVTWHLEWRGRPFPFSKGCSFYRLVEENGKKQIVYGRDSVEPSFKPGESALVAIKGVTWLLQRFPQLADRL
ncbi:hypothetical protein Syun_014199 [Stephania yunnanensis]|uniref:SnoaL-like domain-containing protein n=1 Tax=Stephania yunnanensis TaxID=152371 RepID=A0AAP0JJA7_9MAGN